MVSIASTGSNNLSDNMEKRDSGINSPNIEETDIS